MSSLPVFARVHDAFGRTLELLGWRGGAIHAYRDALRVEPGFLGARFRLGEALARSGKWDESCEAFAEAARIRPQSVEAQGNLVLTLHHAGRTDELAAALYRLTELRPREGELFMLLGSVLKRIGRPEEAIRAFRWAVRLTPAASSRRFFLGEALLGVRGWQEALVFWKDAQRLDPNWRVEDEQLPGRSALHEHPGDRLDDRPQVPVRRGRLARIVQSWERVREELRQPFEPFSATIDREDRARTILHAYREGRRSPAGRRRGAA